MLNKLTKPQKIALFIAGAIALGVLIYLGVDPADDFAGLNK